MNTLTYIIADDEMIYRELVLQYVAAVPGLICLKVCENAIEVNHALQVELPDILLLDIEMPGLSGLQLVKSLHKMPYIIFISSHPHYAADAYEVDAVDFIKKPIPPERLIRAIEKVRSLIKIKEAIGNHEGFKLNDKDSFFIREDGAFVRIRYEDVLFIESLTDFVKIHLANGSEKMVLVNLKNIEQQLPSSVFIRISRTYIVNKQKVSAVNTGSLQIGKISLPIGVTYTDIVIQSVVGDAAIKRHV